MGYYSQVNGDITGVINDNFISFIQESFENGFGDFVDTSAIQNYFENKMDKSLSVDAKFWIEHYDFSGNMLFVVNINNYGKAYDIEDNIREIVSVMSEFADNIDGEINIEGEGNLDISRIVINDGAVKFQKAKVVVVFED